MRYVHEQRRAWLTWFLDAATADEQDLRRALRSVPDESWLFVQTQRRSDIDDVIGHLFTTSAEGSVVRIDHTTVTVPVHAVLALKQDLLHEERQRRLTKTGVR